MFKNIGGKLKGLAIFCTVVGIIAAIGGGIAVGASFESALLGILIAVVGSLISWLSSMLMYGVGEMNTMMVESKAEYDKKLLEMGRELSSLKNQLRGMETKTAEVPVNPVRSKPASAPEANPEQKANEDGASTALGISMEDLPKRAGVRVTAVERTGLSAKAGIKVGDMIVSINDAEISCVKDIEQRAARWKVGSTVFLKLRRDGAFVNTSIKF